MNLFKGSQENFCSICQQDDHEEQYHTLRCGHQLHFNCVYTMVVDGRHYECPNCRNNFTEHWVNSYEAFIYNEADNRNERQRWLTRLGQLRELWARQRQAMLPPFPHSPMNTPPQGGHQNDFQIEAVGHPPIEEFMIDQDGNWVLQLGQEENIPPLVPVPAPTAHRQIFHGAQSLIPDRRASVRRRQQRLQDRTNLSERDADDERQSSSSSQ